MLIIKNIYEKYKQDVFKYLVSLTHSPSLSEDLLSETFIGAIKSLPSFKGDSDIKTWLFSIARYKWYEYLRKEKDNVSFDDFAENYLTEKINLESRVINIEIAEKIRLLLESESVKTRGIILMRIEGYSFYEISQKYSISESSARVVNFRAKKN